MMVMMMMKYNDDPVLKMSPATVMIEVSLLSSGLPGGDEDA